MNDEQQRIIETLERGNLVGRTSGESRVLGGTTTEVTSARDERFNALLLMPDHAFAIERDRLSMSWVGLIELHETSLCVFAAKDPAIVAQGMVDYFALAKASGMTLRQVREQLHQVEKAEIQLFAVSATEIQLYWEALSYHQASWLSEQGDEQPRASLHLDTASHEWKLKDAQGKKVKGGTLAEVSQSTIKMRNAV